ncbi:MAG: zinc metalloprotease HtpX [Proteobacteria bacterium]|nr:zinc metalloprotease HtpX [Pseudomonadota bacterium]
MEGSTQAPIDSQIQRRHKRRNFLQSGVLLAAMIATVTVCAAFVFGLQAAIWALAGAGIGTLIAPSMSPGFILRMLGGRRIDYSQFPEIGVVLTELTYHAGLPVVPAFFYLPTALPNALLMGTRKAPIIAVSDGLLRVLDLRELTGVLAHEISHLRNHDLWVTNLAAVIVQLTRYLAVCGIVLAVVAGSDAAGGAAQLFFFLLLLWSMPLAIGLLHAALSRTREFDADLGAAGLTCDPAGLASALQKLERFQTGFWARVFLPCRWRPDRSTLGTHPPTAERVSRLLALKNRYAVEPTHAPAPLGVPPQFAAMLGQPWWTRGP